MSYTEVNIKIPDEMVMYIQPKNQHEELVRNALMLYPYIMDNTISHGRAAEILGIPKYDLIEIYDEMGLAYLSFDIREVADEVADWKALKGEKI